MKFTRRQTLLVIFLAMSCRIFAQDNIECKHYIKYEFLWKGLEINPGDIILKDTIIHYYNDSIFFKFFIIDCRGKANFELFLNHKLRISGSFENGLDTLKEQVEVINPEPPYTFGGIVVSKYFEGLKSGVWKYYDKNNNPVLTTIYKNGWANIDPGNSEDGNIFVF